VFRYKAGARNAHAAADIGGGDTGADTVVIAQIRSICCVSGLQRASVLRLLGENPAAADGVFKVRVLG
jgi:hypothetical protein